MSSGSEELIRSEESGIMIEDDEKKQYQEGDETFSMIGKLKSSKISTERGYPENTNTMTQESDRYVLLIQFAGCECIARICRERKKEKIE